MGADPPRGLGPTQGGGHLRLEVEVGVASEANEVAAIASSRVLAVAESPGGHGSGWVAARFVARAIAAQVGGDDVQAAGAAADEPDAKRWTGDAARRLEADLDDRLGGGGSLRALFDQLDQRLQAERLMASATGLTIDGAQVEGAHLGAGAAWCVRARTGQVELVAVPHEFDRVKHRITDPALVAAPLGNLVVTALGNGAAGGGFGIGVDSFRAELALGDVIVLMSRPIELPLLDLVRAHRHQPLGALAQAVTRELARAERPARQVSFALARCTDAPPGRRREAPAEPVHHVSAAALRAEPARYSGMKVRFRASATNQLEAMQILGAWWSPRGPVPPPGTHLVDVEGVWRAVAPGAAPDFGHLGQWHASIAAHVQLVPADAPSACRGGRVEEAPEFEWLAAAGELRCMLSGQTWRGLDVRGTTSGWLVPRPSVPELRGIEAVCFREGRTLFVHTAQVSEPRALAPTRVTVAELMQFTRADYVEVEGELALGPARPFADRPDLLSWPVFAGMEVYLPGLPSYHPPTHDSAGAWLEPLQRGPRWVRLVAEVDPRSAIVPDAHGLQYRSRRRLLATAITFL